MGAFGYGPFDNDAALDWRDEHILAPIEATLDKVRSVRQLKLTDVWTASVKTPERGLGDDVLAALAIALDLGLLPKLDDKAVVDGMLYVIHDDEPRGWRVPAKRAAALATIVDRLARVRYPGKRTGYLAREDVQKIRSALKEALRAPTDPDQRPPQRRRRTSKSDR